jgi:ABC-type lipoprotein release transport system permease subunit
LLGLTGAAAVARALQGQIFGVRPTDPLLLGVVTILTGLMALLACVVPARRATRVNPVDVLSEP